MRGTVVSDGEAVLRVTAVGDRSAYGQLARDLQGEERDSPLKVKLTELAKGISRFGYIGATLIAVAFMFKKAAIDHGFAAAAMLAYLSDWPLVLSDAITALVLAIIIVVVAVPEGLPMMIALVLAMNMKKLLKAKVLVRKLIGIETAGSMNILFTDKTGTLTKGELEAVTFLSGSALHYPAFAALPKGLREAVAFGIHENTACVLNDGVIIGGNATERALMTFVDPTHTHPFAVRATRIIPFNSARKFSATHVTGKADLTLVKGASEALLARCRDYLDEDDREQPLDMIQRTALNRNMNEMAERSIRLVALAMTREPLPEDDDRLPAELTLIGIVGIRDDLRPESAAAIHEARRAGIQVVMITGDRKETAAAIARETGLLAHPNDLVLTSQEINALSDAELRQRLLHLRVVARALPTDKSRLVRIAQSMGLVVGMTGDGVNDAPALSQADVGFAMGSGTEVAKESGDVVILDDNFASITRAVLYGRTIFNSIRKFLVFQLTVNVAAIAIAFLGPFFGIDMPLTMVQLLWVNLVMDTLAALAFGGEAALSRYMQERPKRRDESIISPDMWSSILVNGSVIAGMSLLFLLSDTVRRVFRDEAAFLTGFFAFFIFLNNFNKFNARTERLNLLGDIRDNPLFLKVVGLIFVVQIVFTYLGGEVLRTVALTPGEWLFVLLASMAIIPVDLARKALRDWRTERQPVPVPAQEIAG